MIKHILLTMLFGATIGATAQLTLPTFEVGAGLALRTTQGFYVPRFSLAGHNIYKGLGLYLTYEQRNNVDFEDGTYQRTLLGPTLYVNPNIYVYGGISPFGSKGLFGEGGIRGARKEIGFAYVFHPFTLHAGYSNTIGFTTGVGFLFGGASNTEMSFQSKSRTRRSKPASSGMSSKSESVRVDTVFITKEITKEVIREVVKESPIESVKKVSQGVKLESTLSLLFKFNSAEYSSLTAVNADSELSALRAQYPNSKLLIVGNTDESGSATYNYNLGLMRALKVANFLMSETGLGEDKIIIRSDGKVRPKADDNDQNRRVDVYIMLEE